jgi:hypothetical protein
MKIGKLTAPAQPGQPAKGLLCLRTMLLSKVAKLLAPRSRQLHTISSSAMTCAN